MKQHLKQLQKKKTDFNTGVSLGFTRFTSYFKSTNFTWADHVRLGATLNDYINAGISVTDLRGCHVARTYIHLRDDFGFNPIDLTINNKLFSASHLRMLYEIDWKRLLLDFAVGPEDYLLRLKLPLNDLVTLGLDITTLVEWPYLAVYKENGRNPPGKNSEDRRRRSMRNALDRKLFIKCTHYLPSHWYSYMGVDYTTLTNVLHLSGDDVWAMWGEKHYLSLAELAKAFGYDEASDDAFPFHITPQKREKSQKKKKHKHRHRQKHKKKTAAKKVKKREKEEKINEEEEEEEEEEMPKSGSFETSENSSESSGIFSFLVSSTEATPMPLPLVNNDDSLSDSDSEERLIRRRLRKQQNSKKKMKMKNKKKRPNEMSVLV